MTKKQKYTYDCVKHAHDNPEWSWDGRGAAYIEVGSSKPHNALTVRSLFQRGLIRYADGGTVYRAGCETHILVLGGKEK